MPLRPNRIRHFINFHNPDPGAMDYEFDEVGGGPGDDIELSIYTNKLVRDLAGDVVWLISRRISGPPYVLYGKFRITGQGEADHEYFRYEVAGKGTHLKRPIKLDRLPWFQRLLQINPHLSQGFQSVKEPEVITGLQASFAEAKRAQFASDSRAT
jgi:hypothetical protein